MPRIGFNQDLNELTISLRMETHRNLLDLIDQQMDNDLTSLAQESERTTRQIEEEKNHTYMDYRDHLAEQYVEREEFKGIFLNSFFAASFALFEHELVHICDRAQGDVNIPFSVRDLGGRDYMTNAKKYLKKLEVAFPADSDEWSKTTKYREVRNKIMHQGGILAETEGIIGFAKKNDVLVAHELRNGKKLFELRLTRKFCSSALRDMEQLLKKVNTAYLQWHQAKMQAST